MGRVLDRVLKEPLLLKVLKAFRVLLTKVSKDFQIKVSKELQVARDPKELLVLK